MEWSNIGRQTKRVFGTFVGVCAVSAVVGFTPAHAASEPDVYGLTTNNSLIRFNESRPDRILSRSSITGVSGETILGFDVRPANGLLYAVSSASKLYTINPATGAATLVSTLNLPLDYTAEIGVDFNPVVDRLRIVTDRGQNLRVNVDTGMVADNDAVTPGIQPDGRLAFVSGGGMPMVSAAAYTENVAGTTTTVLYVIDFGKDGLFTQNPPNAGTLNNVGSLGVNASAVVGFDIFTDEDGNNARAAIKVEGKNESGFYTVDLKSGKAKLKSKGLIGGGGIVVRDIAVAP